MPRYMIERIWEVEPEEMPNMGRRSKEITAEQFPQITWEHSHIAVDSEGNLKSYCVYDAADEEIVRRHADVLGFHSVIHVYEIAGDAKPDDFPL